MLIRRDEKPEFPGTLKQSRNHCRIAMSRLKQFQSDCFLGCIFFRVVVLFCAVYYQANLLTTAIAFHMSLRDEAPSGLLRFLHLADISTTFQYHRSKSVCVLRR